MSDKRKSILSIDGALDAMKAKDMWKGLKGVANPPDQLEAARKRGKLSLMYDAELINSGRTGNCEMGR
jgi:hypothetical protein